MNEIFEIEVNRGLVQQEDTSPEIVSNPGDGFTITRRMNFAELPTESDSRVVDSYLYEPYKDTSKLIYLDLLLHKSGDVYLPVDITNMYGSTGRVKDTDHTVLENQINDNLLTTKFGTSIYTSNNSLILSETEKGYFLLRFDVGDTTTVLGYWINTAYDTNLAIMSYPDQCYNVNKNEPYSLYYNEVDSNSKTKFGYYWKFDSGCLVPAILDSTEWNVPNDRGEVFVQDKAAVALKELKICPYYYNRAVIIPREVIDGKYYYSGYVNSDGKSVPYTEKDYYKFNYLVSLEFPTNELKESPDYIPDQFYVVHHYQTDASKFKFIVQPNWTSDSDGVPVAMEVYAKCYDADGNWMEDMDTTFLCRNLKDGTKEVVTAYSEECNIDITQNQVPLVKDEKFTITSKNFDRSKVSKVELVITPLMVYDRLDEKARTVTIDCSKIMSGDCEFTNWAYYNISNSGEYTITLTYGLNLYLSDSMSVSEARIDFYDAAKFVSDSGITLPASFSTATPDYTLDIIGKATTSGIFTDEISFTEDMWDKLYICRTLIKVKVGSTTLTHTLFRYLFANTDMNEYYSEYEDFNDAYLDFNHYASLDLNIGNISYAQECPLFDNSQEIYTQTKNENLNGETQNIKLDWHQLKSNDSISITPKVKGWDFSKNDFKLNHNYGFVTKSGGEANCDVEITQSQKEITADEIKPTVMFESVMSYLNRTADKEKLLNKWGIELDGEDYSVGKCVIICPNMHCYNKNSDLYYLLGQGTVNEKTQVQIDSYKETNWIELERSQGGYKKKNAEKIPFLFNDFVEKSVDELNLNTFNGFRLALTTGMQRGTSSSRSKYAKYEESEGMSIFTEKSVKDLSVQTTVPYDKFNDNTVKLSQLDCNNIFGEFIFYLNGKAYQTGLYCLLGKNDRSVFTTDGYCDTHTVGNMIATKLSQYYFYKKVDDKSPIPKKADGQWYENTYKVTNTDICVKDRIKIESKSKYANYVGDGVCYLNYNNIATYNGILLSALNNAMSVHQEAKLDSNNMKFTPCKEDEKYNDVVKNLTITKEDFIKLCNSENQEVVLCISPNNVIRYIGLDRDLLETYSKKTFIWPYSESKENPGYPQMLEKGCSYNVLLTGNIKSENCDGNQYTYLKTTSDKFVDIKPAFDYLDPDDMFIPSNWNSDKHDLTGRLWIHIDTAKSGWVLRVMTQMATDSNSQWI